MCCRTDPSSLPGLAIQRPALCLLPTPALSLELGGHTNTYTKDRMTSPSVQDRILMSSTFLYTRCAYRTGVLCDLAPKESELGTSCLRCILRTSETDFRVSKPGTSQLPRGDEGGRRFAKLGRLLCLL